MAEESKSGLSEVAEKSANTANAIKGAVKTGKAIAAASKGAAVGGPYGAVAGAVWENRKHIGKIIIVVVAIMMIPILIIVMLPAMIFSAIGGFFSGLFGGGGSADIPPDIMNNNAAIIENIETIGSSLNEILLEALDDVYVRIDSDYKTITADRKDVYNPYEGSNIIDANLIISQFCAKNEKDLAKITLDELEKTVRANKSALFSFTKYTATETHIEITTIKATETDPKTGAKTEVEKQIETEVSETVVYYTVVYNGNTHFADAVFKLTPEQKALAEDYNSNLHMFLDDNLIVTANTTHALLAQLAVENPYTGVIEGYGTPFDSGWKAAVTSEFGPRTDPITGEINAGHTGIDIAFPLGTEIKAVKSGKVLYVRYPTTGYGYHLAINHGNGIITLYAHCSKILVNEGDTVSKGDVIAYVGSTGRSTGPHLHFEVILNGVPQDPRGYLP